MAGWSHSHFLLSLGWAILNSFWQLAFLWCSYLLLGHVLNFSSSRKYQLSVASIGAGFIWFLFTFFYYLDNTITNRFSIFNSSILETYEWLNIALLSASISYLALFVFPIYQLFINWKFLLKIKKNGLHKTTPANRLFVSHISTLLGIQRKVGIYVSEWVNSPVTIGFVKPIILLPVAALTNLSTIQVEAILLHELSHIRRCDYLVNLITSMIHTIMYFNPFMKFFIKNIEVEREICCDQLVLQFGYDKVGYASALLTLEKLSSHCHLLALGASGKSYLLTRIEKIIGAEKKNGVERNQLGRIVGALLCIIVLNSVFIFNSKKEKDTSLYQNNLSAPFALFDPLRNNSSASYHSKLKYHENKKEMIKSSEATIVNVPVDPLIESKTTQKSHLENQWRNVVLDEIDAGLTFEEKAGIKKNVKATKKVVGDYQWKEIENYMIGDAMSESEKSKAKNEFLKALESSVNWKNIENVMKSKYHEIDWNKVNTKIKLALVNLKLDSLQKNYSAILSQLNAIHTEDSITNVTNVNPMPDQSLKEIQQAKDEIRKSILVIRAFRNPKKVVRL